MDIDLLLYRHVSSFMDLISIKHTKALAELKLPRLIQSKVDRYHAAKNPSKFPVYNQTENLVRAGAAIGRNKV